MNYLIRLAGSILWIATIDENRGASGGSAGFHVTPAITDHVTAGKVDVPLGCGLQKQTRLGLAALALIGIDVKTDLDVIDRQPLTKFRMHGVDRGSGRAAGRHVRLVGHHHQQETGCLGSTGGLDDAWQQLKLSQRGWGDRTTVPFHIGVEHAVAIEEYGPRYHLVAFFCSLGCDTKQCQITAWSAAACGVTRDGPTVGTTTTTSPACLV